MESVIYEDSPLAQYLEAEGQASDWDPVPVDSDPPSPSEPSFAPRGKPTMALLLAYTVLAPYVETLLTFLIYNQALTEIQRAVNSRLGRGDNAKFLEQFRYIIIASQLLNVNTNAPFYDPSSAADQPAIAQTVTQLSLAGVVATGIGAFLLVWIIHWTRGVGNSQPGKWRLSVVVSLFAVVIAVLYAYIRRKWLTYIRQQTMDSTSQFISGSQNFDAAAAASIALIQEVELVSRGYRLSAPLPPISRLEEQSQGRRCARLRKTLKDCFSAALPPFIQTCDNLRPLAVEIDLERYLDIYEVNRLDVQEAELGISDADESDGESLKGLKTLFHRLRTLRRALLCCLLAIDADGGKTDFGRWGSVIDEIQQLDGITTDATKKLRRILNEEEQFNVPVSPKVPLTPAKERVRVQLRKLSALAQGVRGLQAKLHVLREEGEKSLEEADEVTELGSSLMAQYESLGIDLKVLLQDWENGKSALAMNINKHEQRISQASSGVKSPTPSLGGVTAVEGSPSDALRALTGDDHKVRSSIDLNNEENEEVFEAIGLPRQRSTLTREERIAKMKDERAKMATARESTQANTHMLRELESVINLRPRARTAVLEARLEQANLLKKVVDAIKDLVQDCNFDCNDSGIALQAMDNSHVALVSMMLTAEGFSPYRCDRNIPLGINLNSLTKVLRCAQNEDILTLKAEDAPDSLNLVFESSESDRLSEYDIKLMEIDQDHLGIPETEYAATVSMPASEFQKICRDLMALSESVSIEATKEGVKFSCTGDIGSGSVTLRQHSNVDKPDANVDISLSEPVALTFSLKYLVNFCKASGLSSQVKLCLSNEVPLLVEYALAGSSYLRFYLAPKIGDEE
ncbi:MAG: hypothetical protein M4579_005057 [Chaenotheca gracillima]|nr:MAG: hypothetical protein M4579_005057 [Chaenotheca gracillima]